MIREQWVGLLALCVALNLQCGTSAVGAAPALSARERDAIQRADPRPPVGLGDTYVATRAEARVPVPLGAFIQWFRCMKLEEVLPGSAGIGRIVRTDPLTGTWGEPGSRRRVVLADGNSLLEEVLISRLPEMFRYEGHVAGACG